MGPTETNPIDDRVKGIRERIVGDVDLKHRKLARIVRLRLVSDPGFPMWDVSYCYGRLENGDYVRVHLPEQQFSRRYLKRDLVDMCKRAGVYGKKLGILDDGVISTLV